jgi:hypothetical protein
MNTQLSPGLGIAEPLSRREFAPEPLPMAASAEHTSKYNKYSDHRSGLPVWRGGSAEHKLGPPPAGRGKRTSAKARGSDLISILFQSVGGLPA